MHFFRTNNNGSNEIWRSCLQRHRHYGPWTYMQANELEETWTRSTWRLPICPGWRRGKEQHFVIKKLYVYMLVYLFPKLIFASINLQNRGIHAVMNSQANATKFCLGQWPQVYKTSVNTHAHARTHTQIHMYKQKMIT